MKRRSFMKGVLGIGAGLAATKVIAKPVKTLNKENMAELGFGLDKPIGASKDGAFAKELWHGVEEWYGEEYKKSKYKWNKALKARK